MAISWKEVGALLTITPDFTGGPQGQETLVRNFIPPFKLFCDVDRGLYFPHFFADMGATRELSAAPILDQIHQVVSSGKVGLVTNNASLDILGDRMGQDNIVQARLWQTTMVDSTIELIFEWRAMERDQPIERIALAKMKTTWVEILSYGVVKPVPLPPFYDDFVATMMPRYEAPDTLPPLPEPYRDLSMGQTVFRAKHGPRTTVPLASKSYETSQLESNLIANIYFSNYSIWMARLRESYFFPLAADAYRAGGRLGVLKCVHCSIHHLREGMPFDTIVVAMALKALHENGIELSFEFFRKENGETVKVAFGEHRAVWMMRDADDRPVAARLPKAITQALLTAARERVVA
jgi:enediyne polyketide synthase